MNARLRRRAGERSKKNCLKASMKRHRANRETLVLARERGQSRRWKGQSDCLVQGIRSSRDISCWLDRAGWIDLLSV